MHPRYIACTTLPCGKRIIKAFSIDNYDEESARVLTIRQRQKQLEQIEGYRVYSESALPPAPETRREQRKVVSEDSMVVEHMPLRRKS